MQESGFIQTVDGNNHVSGFSYDLSGNASSDGVNSYTWNGESQLKTAGGLSYLYDGDGRRVAKANTAVPPVPNKLYWYGSGGEILAETDGVGSTQNEYIFFGGKRVAQVPATGNPIYYVEDLLGSSRVVTTNAGVLCYDADFYPFGVERTPAYTNTCPQNYKFEGKERDTETLNDDFGERYYSNRFGRWLSADWSAVPVPVPYATLTNPQSLNLYSMVTDDPESYADLVGHCPDGADVCFMPQLAKDPNYMAGYQRGVKMGLGFLGAAIVTAAAGEAVGVAGAVTIARNLFGLAMATAPVTLPIIGGAIDDLSPGAPGTLTISSATRLKADEIDIGVRLAEQEGLRLIEGSHRGNDFVAIAANGEKITIDAIGRPGAFTNGNFAEFFHALKEHLNGKSVDLVALSFKGASKDQIEIINAFIRNLSIKERGKIIYVLQ